jgi:uncharacterized protein YoxC
MEQKIEEAQFEMVCTYCDKLNLLEKHREVFLKLQDCLEATVKDLNDGREQVAELTDSNRKLQELVENMKKANTNLVIEYEDKLLSKQDEIKDRDATIEGFSDYGKLQQNHKDLASKHEQVTKKMDGLIKQNTELSKHRRDLENRVLELETVAHSVKPQSHPVDVVSPEDESYRAKVQADLERKQKETIDQIKRDFSAKFEELRKSFAMKVEPLDKKKEQ